MPEHREGVGTGSGKPSTKLQGMPSAGQVKGSVSTNPGPAAPTRGKATGGNIQSAAKMGAEEARNPRT